MNESNQNQRQQAQPDTPNQERRFHLKNGQLIPETEFQRRVREYRELDLQGLVANKMYESQVTLNAKYFAARKELESPQREAEQLRALFDSVITLHRHFIAWEDNRAKDLRWKQAIEIGGPQKQDSELRWNHSICKE